MAFTDNSTGGRNIIQGIMPIKIAVTDTCEVGDLIGYDAITSSAWEKADADGKIPAQLIAGEPCSTSGDTITCYKMAYVSGFTLATAGDMVYLSDTAGDYAATPGNWVHQCVGQCISATEAFINPTCTPLMGYATVGTGMGAFIRAELASGRTAPTATGGFSGMRVDVKTIATSVVAGDVYGIYVFGQLQQIPTAGSSAMLRLEDGCSASCGFDSFITFITANLDSPDYLFDLGSLNAPTNGCWNVTGAGPTTAAGQLKLKSASGTRYIKLWSTSQ